MGVNSCHWSVDVRNICLFVCLFVPNPNPNPHECGSGFGSILSKYVQQEMESGERLDCDPKSEQEVKCLF